MLNRRLRSAQRPRKLATFGFATRLSRYLLRASLQGWKRCCAKEVNFTRCCSPASFSRTGTTACVQPPATFRSVPQLGWWSLATGTGPRTLRWLPRLRKTCRSHWGSATFRSALARQTSRCNPIPYDNRKFHNNITSHTLL